MPTDEALGALLGSHEVANRRSLAIGVLCFVIAGLAVATMVSVPVELDKIGGAAAGVGLLAVLAGVSMVAKALRRGLTEVFEVRTGGLVHRSGQRVHGWRWDQLRHLDLNETPQAPAISQYFGWNIRCTLRFDDGEPVVVDGTAADPEGLVRTVQHYCPQAGPCLANQQRWIRFGIGWLLLGLVFLGSAVLLFVRLTEDDDVTDSMIPFIATGFIALILGGVTSLSVYAQVVRKKRTG